MGPDIAPSAGPRPVDTIADDHSPAGTSWRGALSGQVPRLLQGAPSVMRYNGQIDVDRETLMRSTEDSTFVLLLIAVSLAFAWILWPFYGAILWAIVFATVFAPAHRRLLSSMGKRANLAALITVLLIVTIVLLPLTLTAMSVVQEATSLYERIENGEVDFGRFLSQLLDALPAWASGLLDRLGIQRPRRFTDSALDRA